MSSGLTFKDLQRCLLVHRRVFVRSGGLIYDLQFLGFVAWAFEIYLGVVVVEAFKLTELQPLSISMKFLTQYLTQWKV